jgi:prephenate dehydrogenase
MTVEMTIIGLGQIGTSVGLALAKHTDQIRRTGHDREMAIAKDAEKLGALDNVVLNLHKSVENADLVLLTVPVDEVRPLLEQIAPDLKEGAVVLDTSPIIAAHMQWAMDQFPPGRNFITYSPTINPIYLEEVGAGQSVAHDDLFHDSLIMITTLTGVEQEALQLACDLASLLGAQTFFVDPTESDGLNAAVRQLPSMAAAALLQAVTRQPGWQEARKIAGRGFTHATWAALHLDEMKTLGLSLLMNRENSLRVLDNLIYALQELRAIIDSEDNDGLLKYMKTSQEARALWWRQRQRSDWENVLPKPDLPTSGEVLGRLFGFRRKKKPE